ncbi:MAG: dTDP-4-dehydrorhamnose reductase [Alphaproteobacteria bacterium HGW-Alphaproteobacteria-2]|nr:MAG: dTDP-4-dehydrorhamnose reductase [Alphaproteobacteria bacterium HGW-Alphaproteobacteria-2]
MTLLVFGATGQLARELARLLPAAGFLSRAEADLSRPEACAAAIAARAPGAVINAAAYTAVDRAEAEEALATRINAEAPAAMARECARRGIPLVQVSTDYVFDGSGTRPRAPGDTTAPLNAYGRSKLAGEEGVRAAGGAHAILRTAWVFSAHGANFVKTMLRLAEEREHLRIVADQTGGPTPAAALAAACVDIAEQLTRDPGKSGTYHLSGAPEVSWAAFAREIFRLSGRRVTVEDIPTARPDWRAGLAAVLRELGEGRA